MTSAKVVHVSQSDEELKKKKKKNRILSEFPTLMAVSLHFSLSEYVPPEFQVQWNAPLLSVSLTSELTVIG